MKFLTTDKFIYLSTKSFFFVIVIWKICLSHASGRQLSFAWFKKNYFKLLFLHPFFIFYFSVKKILENYLP